MPICALSRPCRFRARHGLEGECRRGLGIFIHPSAYLPEYLPMPAMSSKACGDQAIPDSQVHYGCVFTHIVGSLFSTYSHGLESCSKSGRHNFCSAARRLTFAVAFRDACFMVSIGHTILFAQRGTLVAFIHKNKCYIESLLYRTLSMIAGFRVGFSVRTSTYGSMMRN